MCAASGRTENFAIGIRWAMSCIASGVPTESYCAAMTVVGTCMSLLAEVASKVAMPRSAVAQDCRSAPRSCSAMS